MAIDGNRLFVDLLCVIVHFALVASIGYASALFSSDGFHLFLTSFLVEGKVLLRNHLCERVGHGFRISMKKVNEPFLFQLKG